MKKIEVAAAHIEGAIDAIIKAARTVNPMSLSSFPPSAMHCLPRVPGRVVLPAPGTASRDHTPAARRRQRGTLLVESMVAIGLISIGVVGLLAQQANLKRQLGSAGYRASAALLSLQAQGIVQNKHWLSTVATLPTDPAQWLPALCGNMDVGCTASQLVGAPGQSQVLQDWMLKTTELLPFSHGAATDELGQTFALGTASAIFARKLVLILRWRPPPSVRANTNPGTATPAERYIQVFYFPDPQVF